jgi:hypothetical protein
MFLYFDYVQTGSGAHPFHWVLSLGVKQLGCVLATELHVVLRLRTSGVIPLLLLYAFIAWIVTTFNIRPQIFVVIVYCYNVLTLML